MPRLLLFAPCLKAITDGDDRSLTVVSALVGLNINVHPGVEMPNSAAVPLNWSAAALFRRMPEDQDRWFELKFWVDVPDLEPFVEVVQPFQVQELSFTFKMNNNHFPVGIQGDVIVRLAMREVGEENWSDLAEYPVHIIHVPVTT